MRVLVCLAIVACGDDPPIGNADWQGRPTGSVPYADFVRAYSAWGSETVVIHTVDSDGSVRCSEARNIKVGALRIELTYAAVAAPGEVPIIAGPLDPTVPAAILDLGRPDFDGGSVTITDVDGIVTATFRATAPNVTVTGTVDAVRCDWF